MENYNQKFHINYNNEIGRGAYGKVYTAIDNNNNQYAAKEINNDKEGEELLSNEILNNTEVQNENLVKFFGINEIDNKFFLIFEYCNGGDLEKNLKKYNEKYNKNINEQIIQKIIKDITNGLSCLHRNQIIHHDLKNGNILVCYETNEDKENVNLLKATFKITDFGLSKKIEISSSPKDEFDTISERNSGNISGTPSYIPPCLIKILIENLFKDNDIIENDAVDMWSLGILAYRLLFLKHPFLSKKDEKSSDGSRKLYLLYNEFKKGNYIIDLKDGPVKSVSKEFIIFIDGLLKIKQEFRNSSEECEYSRFVTRDFSKFHFLNSENCSQEIDKKIIGEDGMLVFDIYDEKKIKEYKGFIEIA